MELIGGMQDVELRTTRLLDHAEREHGRREIVTRWADGHETRTNWAGIAHDARRLAQALERLGCGRGPLVVHIPIRNRRDGEPGTISTNGTTNAKR